MGTTLALVLVVAALVLGTLLGWLAAGRAAGEAARLLRLQLDAVVGEREAARAAIEPVRDARDAALRRLDALEAGEAERARGFEQRIAELKEAKEGLAAQFNEIGSKLLGEAQKAFLERADARFKEAETKTGLELKALLNPVETTLKAYSEKLGEIEKARVGSYGELREALGQIAQNNEVVRRETARLTNVLRSSPKHRGRWGEEQLRNILQGAGLAENVDFTLQSTVNDGERQLRPDCVINLPGGRCIVVDVKCPLVHFEAAFDEEDEGRRGELLLAHANAMKSYAADLGRKGYWRQFDRSPDFVIMFIPGEHFLAAAAERAPELIEAAFRNGVIIASTINMLALAKVMAGMWRQEALAEQAQEVAAVGRELYKRLATMGDHVARLGRSLGQATGAYNAMVGSLESQVMTQARRFEALKVDTGGKTIDPLPLADENVRPLTKLVSND